MIVGLSVIEGEVGTNGWMNAVVGGWDGAKTCKIECALRNLFLLKEQALTVGSN